MTMMVIHTEPDRATIMSDSAVYMNNGRFVTMRDKPKVAPLPGINAAVTSRGGFVAGHRWRVAAINLAQRVADFDEFVALAGDEVELAAGSDQLFAYMIGWSPRQGRVCSYVADLEDGLKVTDISDEFHVTPAPPGVKPTWGEIRVLENQLGKSPLPAGQPLDPPSSTRQWVELAKRIHRERACAPAGKLKTWLGGKVTLTRVGRGTVTHETIHEFGDDDFRAMVRGTFNPLGQLGQCDCGSGRRFIDCHMPQFEERACLCRSGKTLRDCCRLTPEQAAEVIAEHPELAASDDSDGDTDERMPALVGAKVGRNDPCPCDSGAKFKRCCG